MYASRWGRPDSVILGLVSVYIIKRYYKKRLPLYVVAAFFMVWDVIGWFIWPALGIGLYSSLLWIPLMDVFASYMFWLFMVWVIKELPFNAYWIGLGIGLAVRSLVYGEGWIMPLIIGIVMYWGIRKMIYGECGMSCKDEYVREK